MNIAIIDDVQQDLDALAEAAREHYDQRQISIQLYTFSSPEDFWNSYSDTSYIADLRDIWKNSRGDRFEILGVVVRRPRSMALTAFEKLQRPWPQVFDDKNLTSESYGSGAGLRILFDPDGKIIARGIHRDSLKTKIAEILGE